LAKNDHTLIEKKLETEVSETTRHMGQDLSSLKTEVMLGEGRQLNFSNRNEREKQDRELIF
jgi:hypothetical protein